MLDSLPGEIFNRVTSLISQEDKVSLTYVSRKVYSLTIPSLYRNLYLNERYYFASDYDNSLGTHLWSVLYFTYVKETNPNSAVSRQSEVATGKFRCLIRSLSESPFKLCTLIKKVHCTWHLDEHAMYDFIEILHKYAINLISFDNFIRNEISDALLPMAKRLHSLNVRPPAILPDTTPDLEYFKYLREMISQYRFSQIDDLTLHVNACSFFRGIKKPLKITTLCINLRNDTYASEGLENLAHYYDIFDVNTLKELEILSWYSGDDELDLYRMWNLREFWMFKNIENLALFSLFASNEFLDGCVRNFDKLRRLKVDFIFDTPVDKAVIDTMARMPCAKTIDYIDIKFEELAPPLLSIEQEDITEFQINISCKCEDCLHTINDIIYKKYFPTPQSLVVKDFHDVEAKNFHLQMFKLYPILPYSHNVGIYPSIGFYCKPIEDHAKSVTELLRVSSNNNEVTVTKDEIICIYHTYMHSLKKTFDYFVRMFPKLAYLSINELPTEVIQFDEQQKCNIPIFYYNNYKSNQVYELINDESLFA